MAGTASNVGHAVGPSGSAGAKGYLHQMGIYGSDEEFRDLIYPFALEGIATGEPVVFAYDPHKMELLQRWLPDAASVTYVTDTGPYATPAKALASWRRLVEDHLAAGARRVRIAGDVPHPGYGRPYAGWDRYEAAIDTALGDLPVWAPCLYDARIAPADVLETATRRHRHLLDRDGAHRVNHSFELPSGLADFLSAAPDPLELTPPIREIIEPTPGGVRAAVRELSRGVVGGDEEDELLLAVSEVVTNALVHGSPPVRVRIWRAEDRIVVQVHDCGLGPSDPLAGLLPGSGGDDEGGRGLWLAHQMNLDVALAVGPDGFTVRLRTGFERP